jgi:Tol biopolymer transport system component
MNANGTSQTNLTKTSAYEYFPAWSPDGTKIAYSGVVTRQLELFKMNPDGTNRVRLTSTSTKDDYWPDWSPNGTQIAFVREAAGGPGGTLYEASAEIYKMNADGKNAVRLTNNTTEDFDPAWSPDGTKIAFDGTRSGNFEIYVMSTDGSNVANRTNKPTDEYGLSWGVAPTE